ncbi:MAG TPA: hypothetical protein VHX63_15105 [Acidobacteriaceae bacterium]|nr:hypothetical protein [Acidobacteriaceae bacterium]
MRTATHVTVPMAVEGSTPVVTLSFKRADGGLRTARFVFDSGGGAIIFDEGLAADLGLKPEGATIVSDGQQYRRVHVPAAFVGGMPVDLGTSNAFVHLGATSFTDRVAVEGLLPGKACEHYQVVLDYPGQLFSVGEAGSLPHRGKRLACRYIASSGHPRVEVGIDGISYGFLLDTGTRITLAREDILRKWSKEHPDWSKSTGAAGPANDGGTSDDHAFLLRIPILQLGAFRLTRVAVASRPDETYSATSYETPAPIIGALGGNILSRFRVEIDYPDQLLFLEQSGSREVDAFDTVGLVLGTNAAGQLIVRAVSSTASAATQRNILPGDVILEIRGFGKAPYTLVQAAQALSGTVGESKQLRILRNGKPMNVTVVVSRIL